MLRTLDEKNHSSSATLESRTSSSSSSSAGLSNVNSTIAIGTTASRTSSVPNQVIEEAQRSNRNIISSEVSSSLITPEVQASSSSTSSSSADPLLHIDQFSSNLSDSAESQLPLERQDLQNKQGDSAGPFMELQSIVRIRFKTEYYILPFIESLV
jgi:hypothetical protein